MPPLPPAEFKAACNRAHAARRADERHDLGPEEVASIESMVRGNHPDARPLRTDADHPDRLLYAVKWAGRWVPVVYDTLTASVVTFLPGHAIDRYRNVIDPPKKPDMEPVKVRPWRSRYDTPTTPPEADPFEGFPAVPDVPEGATLADYDAAIAAVHERQIAVMKAQGLAARHRNPELLRLADLRRKLRRDRHEVLQRQDASGACDPTDAAAVLRALLHATDVLMAAVTVRGNFEEAVYDARKAARYYLKTHGSTTT